MKRVVFAGAMAMIVFSGTSIAAPIAPLPTTASANDVIRTHYWHGHYYPYYHHHHYYHHRDWRHHHWYYW